MKKASELGTEAEGTYKSVSDKGIVFHERYIDQKESEQRKMRILNKHLLPSNIATEGEFELPKVRPYSGPIPEIFIPYQTSFISILRKL